MSTPRKSDPVIGIDLGTSNSLAAIVQAGVPTVLKTQEGGALVPSVVSFRDGERPVVGLAAKRFKVRDAVHTVFSVKRLLGRSYGDVENTAQQLPYHLVAGEGGACIEVSGQIYSPIEISAMILREVKRGAEAALGVPVSRAVVTVPAYFNDSQRQATRAAARLAGLDVLRIVSEPTAAALAYGLDRKKRGIVAVYDMGGGTFDISILKLKNGVFEVLATHGDTALGGDDLDQAIAKKMAQEVQEAYGFDLWETPSSRASLLEASEELKVLLSSEISADFRLLLPNQEEFKRLWSVEEFADCVRPILARTQKACEAALADAGCRTQDLTDVVMVGGPTRLKIVQKVAEEIFGQKPNTSMHPDEVVAQGAAIQADILAGHNKELLLLDVVPLSLGLETYGGLMNVLIPRNTKIPAVVRENFTTFVDGQTAVDIHVLQGEREKVEDNRSLARFKLRGIQPSPAGFPRIEVRFLIDADGILQVAAKDLQSGKEQIVEVKPSYGLTSEQFEKLRTLTDQSAKDDIEFRQLVQTRLEVEPTLRAAEKRMADARRLLADDEVKVIVTKIAGMKEAMHGRDPGKIREAASELGRVTQKLADLIIKESLVD